MKFIQVSMITPNGDCIYAPSRLHLAPVTLTGDATPRRGLVSFQPDGISDPVEMVLYGCWHIKLEDARQYGWQAGYVLELPVVKLSAAGFEVING